MTVQPSTFTTQLAYRISEDGVIQRVADDNLVKSPLTIIAGGDLDARTTARLLRRLSDELEGGG